MNIDLVTRTDDIASADSAPRPQRPRAPTCRGKWHFETPPVRAVEMSTEKLPEAA